MKNLFMVLVLVCLGLVAWTVAVHMIQKPHNINEQENVIKPDELLAEKFVLVQYIKSNIPIFDAFGDTVNIYNYYALPKNGALLIPVDYFHKMDPISRMSIDEYLQSLKSMGNLKSDTIHYTALGSNYAKILLKRFHLKNLSMGPASFN